jgi:hypothetical protein
LQDPSYNRKIMKVGGGGGGGGGLSRMRPNRRTFDRRLVTITSRI